MIAHQNPTALSHTFSQVIRANDTSTTNGKLLSLGKHCLQPGYYHKYITIWLEHFSHKQVRTYTQYFAIGYTEFVHLYIEVSLALAPYYKHLLTLLSDRGHLYSDALCGWRSFNQTSSDSFELGSKLLESRAYGLQLHTEVSKLSICAIVNPAGDTCICMRSKIYND